MSTENETQADQSAQSKIDLLLEKMISRKLLVFLTATGLMAWDGLESETWGMVAIVYIGGQAVVDAMKAYRHGS
jgi:hypothetical protein